MPRPDPKYSKITGWKGNPLRPAPRPPRVCGASARSSTGPCSATATTPAASSPPSRAAIAAAPRRPSSSTTWPRSSRGSRPRPRPAVAGPARAPRSPIRTSSRSWRARTRSSRPSGRAPSSSSRARPGCGKSTQIPKMCLEAGRGVAGLVGCTQPRRIAAVTIAYRIAEELGEELGRSVGYKIRFQDRTPRDGYVKIMTDGILLAETQGDRRLLDYDTVIIDEAHERSLNIDFLLGIMRRLLDERPELKLIITSATLDTEKFSKAFRQRAGRRGQRPALPGRGRVPGAREGRGRGQGLRRPGGRGRRVPAAGEAAGRRPRLHADRAGHPRDAADARGPEISGDDGPAALLAPAGRGTAPGLHGGGGEDRRGHERRRDVADHPRHPLRRRHGRRADRPVPAGDADQQPADQPGLARSRPTSARGGAAASARGCACGSTRRPITRRATSSPRPRSCAPTWPRSSCG